MDKSSAIDQPKQITNDRNANNQTVQAKKKSPSVARSAGLISLAVMASRILGLVREMVFSRLFGASASYAYDAYVIAFRIPNLLRDLFAEGALSNAFVTVFSDYLVTRGEKAAFRLSNLIATVLIFILGVFVVLGVIFAPELVSLFASGFKSNPDKFALTVKLTRIMMPFILLVALAAQAMGLLNSRDRFGIPALSASFFNVGSIIGGLFFAVIMTGRDFAHPVQSVLDHPIEGIVGMAYGVLIGGFLQFAVQWPSLRKVGFHFRPMLSFRDEGVRRIFKLMGPAVIGAAAVQINVLINSQFASSIPGDGAVSWLSYAFRLMQFPLGVFGVAIATATLPSISKNAALREIEDFRHTLASSIRLVFVLTIPSAVGLIVLGRPIIALIYESAKFKASDTQHTAAALACYAIGLAGYSALKVIVPAFYALGDAKFPMRISLFSIVINYALNWSLVGVLQERGLALSTSAVALLNFFVLYFVLQRRINGIEGKRTFVAVLKIILASIAMALVCWLVSQGIHQFVGDNRIARMINVIVSVSAGASVFYIAALMLGVEELKSAMNAILGRFIRRLRK
ncbi:MAG: murein biosynthesis integral membrane protein MurJ [Acidobacteriota bacterium]